MGVEERKVREGLRLRPLLLLLPLLHPVADAGHGEDEGRVGRVLAQLAAQPLDDVPHRPGVLALVRSPDPLQQMLVGQRPPRVDPKLDHQPVLDVGELHGASGHRHPAPGIVDGLLAPG